MESTPRGQMHRPKAAGVACGFKIDAQFPCQSNGFKALGFSEADRDVLVAPDGRHHGCLVARCREQRICAVGDEQSA